MTAINQIVNVNSFYFKGEAQLKTYPRSVEFGNTMISFHDGLRFLVRKGQRIDQGSRIGAVGATGWATGPHLHFEFKVRGAQVNPMVMAKSSEAVELSGASRERFAGVARQIRGQLDAALTVGNTVAE